MSRSHANQSPAALPIAAVLLVITTLAPTALTSWMTAFRGPFMAFLAPVSHPGTWLSRRLRPPVELETPVEQATREQLEAQLYELLQMHARATRENLDLRAMIAQLQSGVPFEDRSSFRQVLASRTGYNARAGLVELRPGALKGVEIGAVALDGSTMQLIGTVTTVGPTTCSVRPITDVNISPSPIEALILPDEPVTPEMLAAAQECSLEPTGAGTLLASVGVDPYADLPVRAGMLVRLNDRAWPGNARMLLIGEVTQVRRTDNPRFVDVIVTPVREPTRLRDVVIRIEDRADGEGGGP
ncbi:MAG: rod shape-determining protein MreC [Phycisphaerales bacterium]